MREIKTLPVELKIRSDDGAGTFEGRASTFNSVDSYGDITVPGAYADTIPQFLTHGFLGWSHDWENPIGMITNAEEREDGLWVSGSFHSDPEAQKYRQRVKERMDRGQFVGMSIGYETEAYEMRKVDEPVRARGEWTDEVRALTKIKLFEVSLVTVPAEPLAGLSRVKGFDISFDDHSEQLQVAISEWLERCKAGSVERQKAGRAISEARRVRIQTVSGSLRSAADELEALIAGRTEEDEEPEAQEQAEEPVVGLSADPEKAELKQLSERISKLLAIYPPPAAGAK